MTQKQKRTYRRAPKRLPIPVRATAPDTGIDTAALNATLQEIGHAGGVSRRTHVLDVFKATYAGAMEFAQKRFENGRLDGLETARLIAAIHDDLVISLFNYATAFVAPADNPTPADILSVCAVGGYGRAEMAPRSDVDILFLVADVKLSARAEQLTEYILYMLWDLNLKVGHATRTVEQCIKLAKEDQTILTSLLDLRFVVGDEGLAEELYARFRRDITKGAGRAYISEKLEERDTRHTREGNSRYVIEPNLKEGKGGLRDLHVLYWITRFLENSAPIVQDPQLAKGYVQMGLFDEQAATRFRRAADFLWRTRHHLHWTAGRATETLSFDMQVKLARLMGHASGPVEVAVERFMREYFTNAREVGALTRIACAKLESQRAIRLPKGLDAFLPGSRRNLKNAALIMDYGRLNFADPMQIREDPSIILQLFETAGRRNIDIHPDAVSEIDFRRNIIDQDYRRNPINAKIFRKLLLNAKAPYATLKAMNESGVLGRYLSEFGGIVARTQFNMHHAYTVDEHTLRLIDHFDNLRKGRLDEEIATAAEIAKSFDDTAVLTMMLTCLLHDTGKGKGDQSIEGAQLARRACNRLGASADMTDTVAWLVRRHLDMSETAQRRDISDPETIAKFAKLVGSIERLNLLYVLTVCDIRAVGPGVWNDWKGTLLRGLYMSTADYLQGREELAPASKAAAIQEQLLERLPEGISSIIAPIANKLPQSYWLGFSMTKMVMHARFFETLLKSGHDVSRDSATKTRVNPRRNVTELWVLTHNRAGLFRDLTLAILASGASITGARLNSSEDGLVMDVFYLLGPDGEPFGAQSEHILSHLRKTAQAAALGDVEKIKIPKAVQSRRAGAIPVRSRVKFPKTKTLGMCIIEVQGRDRPGLLYALADLLAAEGLDIASAHAEVVGTTAIDVFYVHCAELGGAREKALRVKLLARLRDPELEKAA